MARSSKVIYRELRKEQKKLSRMPLRSEFTLRQSQKVDGLVNEYYQALEAEKLCMRIAMV